MNRFWRGFFAGVVSCGLALFVRRWIAAMIETQRLLDEISAWGEGMRQATRAAGPERGQGDDDDK